MLSKLVLIASVIVTLFSFGPAAAQETWYQPFEARREFFVAAGADGAGTQDNPMALEAAMETAEPGDLYWLLEGVYNGFFEFQREGSAAAPIVYRAFPGDHVQVVGKIKFSGDHIWLWGMDIADPQESVEESSGVEIRAAGIRLINNYIHDHTNHNGVGAWDAGPGQVIYGNIIHSNGRPTVDDRHPHNIYTQNNYDENGYKYFVDNIIMNAMCDNCFNFHAYTEEGFINGFYLGNNIIANGRFLIGGFAEPSANHYLDSNIFYQSSVIFGYRRPTQAEFTRNRLYQSSLDLGWFWGAGEVRYEQELPNRFTGNMIVDPSGDYINFRTSAYLETDRAEGVPRIQEADVFDYNIYAGTFTADFEAAGEKQEDITFEDWLELSENAGNAFDRNSMLISLPQKPQIAVIPNQYEAGRAHVAVYAAGHDEVVVDLAPVVPPGAAFRVYHAMDLYGEPLLTGIYTEPVLLSLLDNDFMAYVVMWEQ